MYHAFLPFSSMKCTIYVKNSGDIKLILINTIMMLTCTNMVKRVQGNSKKTTMYCANSPIKSCIILEYMI